MVEEETDHFSCRSNWGKTRILSMESWASADLDQTPPAVFGHHVQLIDISHGVNMTCSLKQRTGLKERKKESAPNIDKSIGWQWRSSFIQVIFLFPWATGLWGSSRKDVASQPRLNSGPSQMGRLVRGEQWRAVRLVSGEAHALQTQHAYQLLTVFHLSRQHSFRAHSRFTLGQKRI